ncbi:unnamed protein product [Ilex paraguariensis]|uniref:Leucine-rich repeat-containing N-terminal plant-type domain-containing protein n=1 Tax=Ilex paraguariensis TaxID=185542 RepID=A0ABC8R786_9AQUA
MARRTPPYWLLVVQFMLTCNITASGTSEAETLLMFKQSLSNTTALDNWNESASLCNGDNPNWNGLLCSNGTFYGLKLEAMGLTGLIDLDTLAELPSLRTISFMNNRFEGPMPKVNKLGALRGVYLSNNNFSGEIPNDNFAGMKSMRRVYLADNQFTGKIPVSLAELPKLVDLELQNNQFEGQIPDFRQKDLVVNVANNRLEGPIPAALSNGTASSFVGIGHSIAGHPGYEVLLEVKRQRLIVVPNGGEWA